MLSYPYILKHGTTGNHWKPLETTGHHWKPLDTTGNHWKTPETTHPKPPKNVQMYPKPQMMKKYIYTRMRFCILLVLHQDFFLEKMCQTTFMPFFWNPPKTLAGNCSAVHFGIRTCLISNFLS